MDLFFDTHTSKKINTFVDEESRIAAERMKEVASQHLDESGSCTLSGREVVKQVLGPGTKGRERMMGKTVGKKKGTKTITEEDMARVVEDIRRENAETVARAVEAIRLENVANMQAAFQAMIANGQLMVPPTGTRQDELDGDDNNTGDGQ